MKTRLQAGAEVDLLNKDELKEALRTVTQDWFTQVARGDRYRRFYASGDVSGTDVTIGGADSQDAVLGPAEGFVWGVTRLAVHGLDANDVVDLHLNDAGPATLVRPGITGYADFSSGQLVMYPGDTLLVTGTGLAATGTLTVTGQARELPMPLAWRLGGG